MRSSLVLVGIALAGCGGSGKDRSKPFIEAADAYGESVGTVAAWRPLLSRKGGTFDAALADHAREQIARATAGGSKIDDGPSSVGLLGVSMTSVSVGCGRGLYEGDEAIAKCVEAVDLFATNVEHTAEDARKAKTPEASVMSMDKPDPKAKEQVDALLAAIEPGPAAKAWNELKTKDGATETGDEMEQICKASAEEWAERLKGGPAAELLIGLDRQGWADCSALLGAQILVDDLLSMCGKPGAPRVCPDDRTCQLVAQSADFAERLPRRYAAGIQAAVVACKR